MTCNCLNCITITRASEALVQKHTLLTGNVSLVVCLYIDMFSYYTVPPSPPPPHTLSLYPQLVLPSHAPLPHTDLHPLQLPPSPLTHSPFFTTHTLPHLCTSPFYVPPLQTLSQPLTPHTLTPSHPHTLTPSHLTHSPQRSDHHLFGQLGESDPLGGVGEGVWKNDRENLAQ